MAASAGIDAWNAVSKTATCGTSGNASRTCSIAASAGGCCSGASAEQLGDRAHDLLVDHDRVETALAAVDDPVPDPGQIGARGGVERVDPLGRLVLADEVELQARRAGVDDQDVAHLTRAPCQVGLPPAR